MVVRLSGSPYAENNQAAVQHFHFDHLFPLDSGIFGYLARRVRRFLTIYEPSTTLGLGDKHRFFPLESSGEGKRCISWSKTWWFSLLDFAILSLAGCCRMRGIHQLTMLGTKHSSHPSVSLALLLHSL